MVCHENYFLTLPQRLVEGQGAPFGLLSALDGARVMENTNDGERFRENWQDEVDSAAEYPAMAASEARSKNRDSVF